MNLPPFEHFPNTLHGHPIMHINYLSVIFPHATGSMPFVVALHTIKWNLLRTTAASFVPSTHTFHKPILVPLPVSNYDSTPSPTAISVPVGVYNFETLCIQWCQKREGRTAVGLCNVCAIAPLDSAQGPIRLHWNQLHWNQLHWVTEDMCVCYSFI
jgi:hypothetical protein